MQSPQNPYGTPNSSQPQSGMSYDGPPLNQPQYMQPPQQPQYDGPPLNQPRYDGPPQNQPQYPQQQQPYMQQPQYPQQQQPYMQQPYMQQPAMNIATTSVNVNIQQKNHGFVIRALYYIFIGWWLGFFWLNLGFLFCFFIITLPVGLVMLNRLPQVLTLRSPGTSTNVNVATTSMQSSGFPGAPGNMMTNTINVNVGGTVQYSFLIRALYYIFVGWWAGYIWACIGYAFCLSLFLFPVGLIMLNRLPMVLTLRKN